MNRVHKILKISQKSIMRKIQPVLKKKSNVNMLRKERKRIKMIQTKISAKEYPISKKKLKDLFTFVFLVIVVYSEEALQNMKNKNTPKMDLIPNVILSGDMAMCSGGGMQLVQDIYDTK